MIQQNLTANYDSSVHISDFSLIEKLGDSALLGKWFVFLKADWPRRSGMERLLAISGLSGAAKPALLFRGKEELSLPGVTISPLPLPGSELVSLTSDKALYRAHHDTVRLLIAAPQHQQRPGATLTLRLSLSGNAYADYPLTLDEYGMCLWSLTGLPEGAYEATLDGFEAAASFEIAEYRLAPLHAELVQQQLSGETLRYTLAVTAFGQPYTGSIEVELQERGQRIGGREELHCNREGQCSGIAKLSGAGPYTLNIFAGDRTASIALKGSEQERRETLTISELGEVREISLLPLPQSNVCRGIYIARGGSNNAPFIVQRVVGSEVEITPRVEVELLNAVVVDPARGTSEEHVFEHLPAGQGIRLPIPVPYGVVLLGAFIDGQAWEGWCGVLRPSELQLQCEAPKEAKPGSRITVKLKTGKADRIVPVQLIVKDARLIAASDPQVELAACIKHNLEDWRKQSGTGTVERQLADYRQAYMPLRPHVMRAMAMPLSSMSVPTTPSIPTGSPTMAMPMDGQSQVAATPAKTITNQQEQRKTAGPSLATLADIRLAFPEIVYNEIVKVQGETAVEVKLGDSITRYGIETFALSPETRDWQRVETTVDAVQPVYGELSVSPFVFPGDPVMGRLHVGAASGGAIAEVRHDNEALPLFFQDGSEVAPGLPIPSGSVVLFPVRPGVITSSVRDARKGGIDVSERYVTEPGRLRHIARRLRLLTPGDEVTMGEPRVLELKPMPGLERPFQMFVEGAVNYPFGCIEQTSCKILAMFTGYITNLEHAEIARNYEAAILVWHKRLQSMSLPNGGFTMYPPEEGGANTPDTHYAPQGVKHLLNLPAAERSGIQQKAILDILNEIASMARKAAAFYKIDLPPKDIADCHAAYQVMMHSNSQRERDKAAAFAREQLQEHNGQTYVEVASGASAYHLYGTAVARRQETAYAAATLLAAGYAADLPKAIAATNYLTGQLNADGRLYSTIDTAASLALLLGLRAAGVVTTADGGLVEVNGQQMKLADALASSEKVEALRCIEGVVAVEVTTEVIEDWRTFKSVLPVEVRLECNGRAQKSFKVGDALDLVIGVPRYEPGMIAHICLPEALARIVGGGQVKRFSLDFCEKNVLRVPLAAISSTALLAMKDAESEQTLLRWLGITDKRASNAQHWAVIVRNMFKEEQIGNPGRLEVIVE